MGESEISRDEMESWWGTKISDIHPGTIRLRGIEIEDLIEGWDFISVVWLMAIGTTPSKQQVKLLEAAMVSSVDHGPQAPSIAAARMAATCGIGLNSAIATGVNLLGDVHGGAGQQCVEIIYEIKGLLDTGIALTVATESVVEKWRSQVKYIPGFGHRFHSRDPRRDPLLNLVDEAVVQGTVPGQCLAIGRAIEDHLSKGRSRPIPMNVDGATAIIYAELNIPAPLARGIFSLSRSVGILAHAWEESQSGSRIKGPMPRSLNPKYIGPN
nr:citryl-CoA lyase [Acidithrix ferrooxidans]